MENCLEKKIKFLKIVKLIKLNINKVLDIDPSKEKNFLESFENKDVVLSKPLEDLDVTEVKSNSLKRKISDLINKESKKPKVNNKISEKSDHSNQINYKNNDFSWLNDKSSSDESFVSVDSDGNVKQDKISEKKIKKKKV